jgi:competence protein CoiA
MLSALRDEELVQAKESSKEQAPFTCPACAAPVLLKKGPIKAPHFAHFLTTGCEYERGEGQLHLRIKTEICSALAEHP